MLDDLKALLENEIKAHVLRMPGMTESSAAVILNDRTYTEAYMAGDFCPSCPVMAKCSHVPAAYYRLKQAMPDWDEDCSKCQVAKGCPVLSRFMH